MSGVSSSVFFRVLGKRAFSETSSPESFFLAPCQCCAKWGLWGSASPTLLPPSFCFKGLCLEEKQLPSWPCARDGATPQGQRSCMGPLLSRGTSGEGRRGQGMAEPSLGALRGSPEARARAWRVRSDGERRNGVGRRARRKNGHEPSCLAPWQAAGGAGGGGSCSPTSSTDCRGDLPREGPRRHRVCCIAGLTARAVCLQPSSSLPRPEAPTCIRPMGASHTPAPRVPC